jgi:hypothetical protein
MMEALRDKPPGWSGARGKREEIPGEFWDFIGIVGLVEGMRRAAAWSAWLTLDLTSSYARG